MAKEHKVDILAEAMIINDVFCDLSEQDITMCEPLDLFSFENFMKKGLNCDLLKTIAREKYLPWFDHNKYIDNLPTIKFLYRYDKMSQTTLINQANAKLDDFYRSEIYSITTFSTKLVYDVNTLCTKQHILNETMTECMESVVTYLKTNVKVCAKLGIQGDKFNLPGLYYKLFMVHKDLISKEKNGSLQENGIYFPNNLFTNITMLIFYGLINIDCKISDIVLSLFSQYILRILERRNITVFDHNAAHILVMCNDLCGILAFNNDVSLWTHVDKEGLLPLEYAMIAMLNEKTMLSKVIFIAVYLKTNLVKNNLNLLNFQLRRMLLDEIFKKLVVREEEEEEALCVNDLNFYELYKHVWTRTDIIQSISCSQIKCMRGMALDKLITIYENQYTEEWKQNNCVNDTLLELVGSKDEKEKVNILQKEFFFLTALPSVHETITTPFMFNSLFTLPKVTIYVINDDGYIDEKIIRLGTQEYFPFYKQVSETFKAISVHYDFSLYSVRTLNDGNSIYAYGKLLNYFENLDEIISIVSLLEEKLKQIGGNAKPHRITSMREANMKSFSDCLYEWINEGDFSLYE